MLNVAFSVSKFRHIDNLALFSPLIDSWDRQKAKLPEIAL